MFNLEKVKQHCSDRGLMFDDRVLNLLWPIIKQAHLTQEQFDIVMKAHIEAVAIIFDPRIYTLKGRLLAAFHFIRGKPLGKTIIDEGIIENDRSDK